MPRVSEAEKKKSHARIVDAAAALFREKGIGETSLAEAMKAAGMTHGGFYRHFSDKDALIRAAFGKAVDDAVAAVESAAETPEREVARRAYIETYLSEVHVDNWRQGCPIAALGSELARADNATRSETAAAIERVAAVVQQGEDRKDGYARLALMVGAITLARLADEPGQRQAILDAAMHWEKSGSEESGS